VTSEVEAHYVAGLGIRPPRKGGRVRGVAHGFEPGGGMELWHCDHDHAPGVKDCRKLTPEQRKAAIDCSAKWLRGQVARDVSKGLPALPVRRDDE
jgi:hypothetical protein